MRPSNDSTTMLLRRLYVCGVRYVIMLVCTVIGQLASAKTDDASLAKQPNIILIVADDLGYSDLSCMGQKNFSTPNIDRLASEGLKFTQFYAGNTVCAPSRACLLTGLHSGHTFQRVNGPIQFRADPQDITVATRLKQAGYKTAMIGKSGLSCQSFDGGLPNRKGFDFFYGFVSHVQAHRFYPRQMWLNGEEKTFPSNTGKEGKVYSGDEFLSASLKFIEDHQQGPFFLHMALQQPHADLQAPTAFIEAHIGEFDERPQSDGYYRAVSHPKATFVGMIDHLDMSVGKVIDTVKSLGIEKDTIILFTSDNGPHSENGHEPEDFDSNGALRGQKRDLYEGGLRVPLLAWCPGRIFHGTTDVISAFWDFPATVCDLAGTNPIEDTDGVSLLPTLTGLGLQEQHEYLYWEFYEQGGKQAVRSGNYKAIRLNVGKDPNGQIELYDLSNDLEEQIDLATQLPDVVKRMERLMEEAHTPSPVVDFANGSQLALTLGRRIPAPLGKLVDRTDWKIAQGVKRPNYLKNIIDGKPETFCNLTFFDKEATNSPKELIVDMGQMENVSGIRILNRQDGQGVGMLRDFKLYFSNTTKFQESVDLSFQLRATMDEQRVGFAATRGRYFKLVPQSEIDDHPAWSMAELNLEADGR